MGLIKIKNVTGEVNGKLGIWKLCESSSSLVEKYSFAGSEEDFYLKITNERRKCEYLSVRMLLHEMLPEKPEILYTEAGKPELLNDYHISISHSSSLVVILLSEQTAGIDVESLDRNTEKVSTRFLSEQEAGHISKTTSPSLTRILYWCAKEALFKCTQLEGIDFKSQILINPFFPLPDSGKFFGQLIKNNQHFNFIFNYFLFENNAVVYCTETKNQF